MDPATPVPSGPGPHPGPGNLATLLRTALAAEVDGVMLAQSVDRASREQTRTP